jgi:hypothetical protein
MLSENNKREIEAAGLGFILGGRIGHIPYVIDEWRRHNPDTVVPDGLTLTQPWPGGPNSTRRDPFGTALSTGCAFDAEGDEPVAFDRRLPRDGAFGLGDLLVDTVQRPSGPVGLVLVVDAPSSTTSVRSAPTRSGAAGATNKPATAAWRPASSNTSTGYAAAANPTKLLDLPARAG